MKRGFVSGTWGKAKLDEAFHASDHGDDRGVFMILLQHGTVTRLLPPVAHRNQMSGPFPGTKYEEDMNSFPDSDAHSGSTDLLKKVARQGLHRSVTLRI